MSNLICFTQDVPGEREWLSQLFPLHRNLETESSTQWGKSNNQSVIWEVPQSDYNLIGVYGLKGAKVKTVFRQNFPVCTLLNNNGWVDAEQLYLHNQVTFADTDTNIPLKKYQMFTFGRSGTVFTESLLKKYPKVENHYVLDDNLELIVNKCQDPATLICLLYRQDWWSWVVSNTIAEHNGFYHYHSKVDFTKLTPVKIGVTELEIFENRIKSTFNFWCNLRMCLPRHQFKLFEFSNVVKQNQDLTNHKKIPYNSADFVIAHDDSKLLFEKQYLHRWKTFEKNSLSHLASMKVNLTSTI